MTYARQGWEYRQIMLQHTDGLDAIDDLGWEVIGVIPGQDGGWPQALLRRRLRSSWRSWHYPHALREQKP